MRRFFDKVSERIGKLDEASRQIQFRSIAGELDFMESVFRALEEGVLALSHEGHLRYANPAADRLLGISFERHLGRALTDVLPDWDWDALLARPASADWSRHVVREIALSYPERRILEISATPAESGVVIVVRDVTAARDRNADDLETGRVDAVCELAAGVAHEIGNPLNALSLELQMASRALEREKDDVRLREKLRSGVDVARREVTRLDGIIRGFLKALRPARVNLEPGNAADPLKDALATLKARFEDRRVRVSVALPDALPVVAIDRAQLEQVYFNLIKNALEAMPEGGALDITLAVTDRDVTLAFRDTGSGISEAELARLFESYRTTKAGGTGLGLMISRRIVRAHGGDIDVESKPGVGTCFTVRLPRLEKRVRRLGMGGAGGSVSA